MKIVLSAVLAMFLIGCSSEKGSQESSQQAAVPKAQTTSAVKPVVKEVAKEVVAPKAQIKAVAKPVVKKVAKAVPSASATVAAPNGAKIFVVCSSCHGPHAEKKALGKSQIIKGWSVKKITTALHGYKAGTYGSSMKAVMQGQASKLSDQDIQAVAKYISNL